MVVYPYPSFLRRQEPKGPKEPLNKSVTWVFIPTRRSCEGRNLGPQRFRFPKFTNEVQHLVKVLPWETNINNSPLKNDVKFPDYVPRTLTAPNRGKSGSRAIDGCSRVDAQLLNLHERHSRLLIARRAPGKAADPIVQAMASILAPSHPSGAGVSPSTTAPSSPGITNSMPWVSRPSSAMSAPPGRKGGVENAIGRMRRFLPRKTDLATLTQERFCQLVQAYNNTPRKCLGYNTPAEVFSNQMLHFVCELRECTQTPGCKRDHPPVFDFPLHESFRPTSVVSPATQWQQVSGTTNHWHQEPASYWQRWASAHRSRSLACRNQSRKYCRSPGQTIPTRTVELRTLGE